MQELQACTIITIIIYDYHAVWGHIRTLGHGLTPDPAPICACRSSEAPRSTKWLQRGIHSHGLRWIQIFRFVLALTLLWSADVLHRGSWGDLNTNQCDNFAAGKQVSWVFNHRDTLINPVSFEEKYTHKSDSNIFSQIRLQKRSQRVWQCTVPFHAFFHVPEHAASPC